MECARVIRFLLLATLLFAVPAGAAEQPYLTPDQVDLITLLPPPPKNDAPDLAQVLAAEAARTPARAAQAAADVNESVFFMFGSVLGNPFTPEAAPLATTLFSRLGETEDSLTDPPKRLYNRRRPFLVSVDVHPVVPMSKSGSYPSGHATRVTLHGLVLARMVPEYRDAIFARMDEYEQSRVIGGAHFPSDIRAGSLAGTAAVAVLFVDPAFKGDYGPARQQLRAALGLPP